MSHLDDLRTAVITAARAHRPTTIQAYASACVDMECDHDPTQECPLVDVQVCATCTAISEDRDPEEWLLRVDQCPVAVTIIALEAAEAEHEAHTAALIEQWRQHRHGAPIVLPPRTDALRDLLDEIAVGYYGIAILELDDAWFDGVAELLTAARADISQPTPTPARDRRGVPAMSSCIDCRYSQPAHMTTDDAIVLECHRHPPTVTLAGHDIDDIVRLWPQVDPDDWCGEHTPSEAVTATQWCPAIYNPDGIAHLCVLNNGHDEPHTNGLTGPNHLDWHGTGSTARRETTS